MAMVIKNNKLATMSLGELNKNIVETGKQISKLSFGLRINGARDGAADFSISEKMRVRIRGLGQDIDNVKTGRTLLQVGEGGIQQIVEALRDMKELAINAANDTNTDLDRITMQKVFDQRKRDIEDIVASTNYNGKLLLDGTYAREHSGVTWGSGGDEVPSPWGPRGASPVPMTSTGPANLETWPSNGAIAYGGAYTIPADYHGTVTISSVAAAGGVRLSGAGPLTNVNIVLESSSTGGAGLWIDNLNITNSTQTPIIQFSGSDNTLTLIGSSTLNLTNGGMAAAVNMGDGLTIQGNGSSLTVNNRSSAGAGIGTNAGQRTSGALRVVDGTLTLNVNNGSAFGSGRKTAAWEILPWRIPQ